MRTTSLTTTLLLGLVLALPLLAACSSQTAREEVSRERAIEIARQHVQFEVREVEAEQATEESRPVWRVTFRGEPMSQTHQMAELVIVFVDRATGEVVSLGMS